MAVKDALLVGTTAAVAGGGTYAVQNASSSSEDINEPKASDIKAKEKQLEKQEKSEPKEILDTLIVDSVSPDYENLSKFRFGTYSHTKNKLLLGWNDTASWIKKVQANVTNRSIWPNDLIFKSNRSDLNLALLLRQKCYLVSDYLSRVHFSNGQESDNAKTDLFKNVDNQFNNENLITLCASDGTYTEEEINKFRESGWKTLNSYTEGKSKYNIASQAPSKDSEANKFHKKQLEEVSTQTFQESMEKYSFYVFKKSGEADKFATKENFGFLYDKLEDIPFFSGILTKKQ